MNRLLQARKQMEKVMKAMGKGKLPSLPPELAGAAGTHPLARPPRSAVGPGCRFSGTMGRRTHDEGIRGNGSTHEIDAGRVEEEPDLPRRGGRLALAARRPLHRDRRAVQPQTDPSTIELDADKVKDWLAKGAQPSDPVARLIKAAGIQGT